MTKYPFVIHILVAPLALAMAIANSPMGPQPAAHSSGVVSWQQPLLTLDENVVSLGING